MFLLLTRVPNELKFTLAPRLPMVVDIPLLLTFK